MSSEARNGFHVKYDDGVQKIRDAAVALRKDRRIVVAVNVLAIHHVFQVADDGRAIEIAILQQQRLVHVQADAES